MCTVVATCGNRQNFLNIISGLKFSNAPLGLSRTPGSDPNKLPSNMIAYFSMFTNDPPPESVRNETYGTEPRCPPMICYNSTNGMYWWGFMGVDLNFNVVMEALVQMAQ